MIFNSLTYILFLTAVALLYWRFSGNFRLFLIFTSSLIFYGFWRVEFVVLLLFSVCVDYFIARNIVLFDGRRRKFLLLVSLATNIGLLIFFKYLYFLQANLSSLGGLLGIQVPSVGINIILPLGISFYTFQTISYTIDVYRGHLIPERNFLAFACFVTFFPQLIAGPVLRAGEVIPQFKKQKSFRLDDVAHGVRRILYGLFLKVVLADNIGALVDGGFLAPTEHLSAYDAWTLAFLFGFQIYFDFSAYSHIAIGSARILGLRFPENFNFPYAARNPREFWKRWHISLSSWIRDYLYLPLIGAKVIPQSKGGLAHAADGKVQSTDKALFASWSIMGLWHGASWNFVIWGVYHATVIYFYRRLSNTALGRLCAPVSMLITLPVMMFSWIPFRAQSVNDALALWGAAINPYKFLMPLGLRENSYIVALLMLIGFYGSYLVRDRMFCLSLIGRSVVVNLQMLIFYAVLFALVLIFLRPSTQFIYFQF